MKKTKKKYNLGGTLPVMGTVASDKDLQKAERRKNVQQNNMPTVKKLGGGLGMKSVNSGYDNNSGVTRADFVAMGKGQAKMGGSYKKGGTIPKKMIKKKK